MRPLASQVVRWLFFLCVANTIRGTIELHALEHPGFERIEARFGIDVRTSGIAFPVTTKHGPIEGEPAADRSIRDYAPLFETEFGLYPPELVKLTGLKRVILCTGLKFAGQRRNAIPDFEHDTLYLDVARGKHARTYLRKVIHHEFFHIVDLRDDGQIYADDRWKALNPPGFEYGDGGRNAQNKSGTSLLSVEFPGFLNHYSTTGVEEDKAEIFANMIVEADKVATRAKTDPIVSAKCDAMRKLLTSYCPEADDPFWRRASSADRSDVEFGMPAKR